MDAGLVQGIRNNARTRSARVGMAVCAAALLVGLSASSAHGAVTIGQLAPGNPADLSCTDSLLDVIQTTPGYVVPAGGAAITSWSTKASVGAGQQVKMKVMRKIGEPGTYQVVGVDGPRTLTPAALNTFPVNIPVQPGDVIGTNFLNGAEVGNACIFDTPGTFILASSGDLNTGQSGPFTNDGNDFSLNLSAVVGFKTSNDIDFVKVKKNKNNGTAVLTVDVPGPGQLSLKGAGVKPQRTGGATISKQVTEAGKVKLRIKAKGAKKEKLLDTGKAKVKVKVTFKPSATGGDVAGDPNTDPKTIKLIDN